MIGQELPIPPHFNPAKVGEVWRVPYQKRADQAEAWAEKYGIRGASEDDFRIALLAVDCQNTFCIPGYGLFVAGRSGRGAIEDNVRLCEFVYRNLGVITEAVTTMDTHTAIQIFHPIFWLDRDGRHPAGGETIITLEDIEKGAWRVNPEVAGSVARGDVGYLERYVLHYLRTLTEGGKYPLLVWPYHSMLGGIGHALVSSLEEALFFHSVARLSRTRIEIKGSNPLTEHYSILGPEVLKGPEGEVTGEENQALVDHLTGFDMVIIAGQAKSHCVAWTVNDLLSNLKGRDRRLVEKIYLLEDCTSPVVVPGGVDFTEQADRAFERFSDEGAHLVRSTDPLDAWPGVHG